MWYSDIILLVWVRSACASKNLCLVPYTITLLLQEKILSNSNIEHKPLRFAYKFQLITPLRMLPVTARCNKGFAVCNLQWVLKHTFQFKTKFQLAEGFKTEDLLHIASKRQISNCCHLEINYCVLSQRFNDARLNWSIFCSRFVGSSYLSVTSSLISSKVQLSCMLQVNTHKYLSTLSTSFNRSIHVTVDLYAARHLLISIQPCSTNLNSLSFDHRLGSVYFYSCWTVFSLVRCQLLLKAWPLFQWLDP